MRQPTPNPGLRRLDALVGVWEITASIGEQAVTGGQTQFQWVDGAFLRQHTDAVVDENAPQEWLANAPFPVTSVIGLDDSADGFTMLYADGRGVARVYGMSMADGVWRMWRAAPGFNQRFSATFSPDLGTITGAWENSSDGTTWKHDFSLTYTRVG